MKVLVIRKPDATIHITPLENEARLKAHNNRLPAHLKWTFEVMDEEEANDLPFIDPSYVPADKAQNKVAELSSDNAAKDAQIKELQAKLAALSAPAKKAEDLIAEINAAATAEEVNELLGSDERKGVLNAAAKKLESFKA